MDLSGHRSSIYSFCFSADSTHAATVSKDGTWRLHRIEFVVVAQQDYRGKDRTQKRGRGEGEKKEEEGIEEKKGLGGGEIDGGGALG